MTKHQVEYLTAQPDAAVVAKLQAANVQLCEDFNCSWRYHLCAADAKSCSKALCGAVTMQSHATVETWGFKPSHMPTTYCKKCELHAIKD